MDGWDIADKFDVQNPYIESGVSPTKEIEGAWSVNASAAEVSRSPKSEVVKTTSSAVGFLIVVFKTSVTSCISTDTNG